MEFGVCQLLIAILNSENQPENKPEKSGIAIYFSPIIKYLVVLIALKLSFLQINLLCQRLC